MLRIFRFFGNIVLWTLTVVGAVAGAFWLATAAGLVQPLVVISGSMEPGIGTGDLLIATKTDTADLQVGDVVSLPSDLTQNLVTHRIEEITPLSGDRWEIEMRGDANGGGDIAPYIVGAEVWKPAVQIPNVGTALSAAMQPGFVVPGVLALVAFLGFAILSDDDDEDEDDVDVDVDHDEGGGDVDPVVVHADVNDDHRADRDDHDLDGWSHWPDPTTADSVEPVRELELTSQ